MSSYILTSADTRSRASVYLAAKASASNSCLREPSDVRGLSRKVNTGSDSMNSSSTMASLVWHS